MPLNILQCDDACFGCVKGYKKKHDLKPGDTFKISCAGIPKEYVSSSMLSTLSPEEAQSMESMLDPVTWAATVLDWHCEDPDGSIWKRKTSDGSLGEVTPYIEEQYGELIKEGKSAFNRQYQKEMLRCTSKRKVFRLGRQCGKTETLAIAILHAIFTHKDFRVIVITPYQTQIELIFGRLEKLIKSQPATNNSLKRYVKAPNFTMELHNGSTIKGFTAGTKSGGNADAVRGQKANMLVFDEADYLSGSDMASALSVITNYPNATVWMSSTPTGKREKFYEACYNKIFRGFHYPSSINPLWSKDLEEFYRGEFTALEYTHEIEAEFGEQEQGVYQSNYIEEAMADYRYSDMKPMAEWLYSIGIDWNDYKVGTTMAVTGYNPALREFRLFHRESVSREGWTQHAAIERLIDLNRTWRPRSIYIDRGYGHTQFEVITKFGWDALADKSKGKNHPDSRLRKIVKQYDFGSKVTIKDLFTKQDVEKAAKPFLIENSVRRFEQRSFKFSKHDTQLEAELRGYVVDHVTVTGAPVYKQSNEKIGDHNLDALNLSLVAFTLDLSPFGVINHDQSIAFTGSFGQKQPQLPLPGIPAPPKPKLSTKPSLDRATPIETPGSGPAYHTNTGQRRLWAWPGFERDAPKPTGRQLTLGHRPGAPTRKKF